MPTPPVPPPNISREEAFRLLREYHTPALDAFRDSLPSVFTSDLLAYSMGSDKLDELLLIDEDGYTAEEEKALYACALAAVAEEIDLRIPPRKP